MPAYLGTALFVEAAHTSVTRRWTVALIAGGLVALAAGFGAISEGGTDDEAKGITLLIDDTRTRPSGRMHPLWDSERDGSGLLLRLASSQSPLAEVEANTPSPTPAPTPTSTPAAKAAENMHYFIQVVAVTFYSCEGGGFCGTMANGVQVYEGASACGYAWPLGTRFTLEGDPTERTYVCEDRGLGPWLWVDIFFWDEADGYAWQEVVGSSAASIASR